MKRLLALLLLAVALPAAAQTAPEAELGATREDCQAAPAMQGGEADAVPGGDLSAKLDRCNGVLQPPPTGDGEIREPAPESGETPVIPPGALPAQPGSGQAPG